MFHPSYLCNISWYFLLLVIFFSLISDKVLISLYNCLDLTHINCTTVPRRVFNFLYKKIVDPIIFIIYVLRLSDTLYKHLFS
jgi:hypothetical protein